MKIQFASDLHLEFKENRRYITDNPISTEGDVLVLAGDIFYLNSPDHLKFAFWDWASDNFKQTLIVPGNHEFYGGFDIAKLPSGNILSIRENVSVYNNSVVEIDDISFILTTLWSKIEPEYASTISQCVADFHQILYAGNPLSVPLFNSEHQKCLNFLQKELTADSVKKRIVVSHHVPSLRCTATEFINSPINNAFSSDLDYFIDEHPVDYWIYGHSHRNMPPVQIGSTTLLSNQLGYIELNEHKGFRSDAAINVS